MPDSPKIATLQIHGTIDDSLKAALAEVRSQLEGLRDLAKLSIEAGSSANPLPSKPFPSLGTGNGATGLPSVTSGVTAPRPAGDATPSAGNWVALAESLKPVQSVLRSILSPLRPGTGSGGGSVPTRSTTPTAPSPLAVEESARTTRRATAQGVAEGLRGLLGRILPPAAVRTPTPAPVATTLPVVRPAPAAEGAGATDPERSALYNSLIRAGATPAEARAAAGLSAAATAPTPSPSPTGGTRGRSGRRGATTAALAGLDAATLTRGALGPLGAVAGVGALGAGVAFGMKWAPEVTGLGMQLGAPQPNALYRGILATKAVRQGTATPTEVSGTVGAMLQAGGRMAGGANAWAFALRDATAAARFARAVGITPSQGGALVGTLQAAGVVGPGGAAAAVGGLYAAQRQSGLPGGTFSQALQQFVTATMPYSIPTMAPQLLANNAQLGQAFNIPALTGSRLGGTMSAMSQGFASGAAFQGMPGIVATSLMAALSPGGRMPSTVGGIYRATEGGLARPSQEVRVLEEMRRLYSPSNPASRNYSVLDALLRSTGFGGYGTAQGTALERNLLGLSHKRFAAAMQLLLKNPKAAPGELAKAVHTFQASYGGSATGIEGGLQVAGARTFQGLAKPLNDLSAALRRLQGPVQAIALELGAGLGLGLLTGRGGIGGGVGGAALLGGGGGLLSGAGAGGVADATLGALPAVGTTLGTSAGMAIGSAGSALAAGASALFAPAVAIPATVAGVGVGLVGAGRMAWQYATTHGKNLHLLPSARFLHGGPPTPAISAATRTAFVKRFSPLAAEVSQATGLSQSFILGEWANETAWGTSQAFRQNHNLEGLKPVGGLSPGADSKYAGFANYQAFAKADIATLTNPRYAKALKAARHGASTATVAGLLRKEGFATAPNFAQSVASTTHEARSIVQAARAATSRTAKGAIAAMESPGWAPPGEALATSTEGAPADSLPYKGPALPTQPTQTAGGTLAPQVHLDGAAGAPTASHVLSAGGQRLRVTVTHEGTDPQGMAALLDWLEGHAHFGARGAN